MDFEFGMLLQNMRVGAMFHLLRDVKDKVGWVKFEVFVVVLWVVWNFHNQWKFKGVAPTVWNVVRDWLV